MKSIHLFMVAVFIAGFFPHQGSAQDGISLSKTTPVLVELFISQGCSSCPPAGELLNGWGMELFRKGRILPLAFHVDYWNYLGWKDPYSSELFTDRQRQYALALRGDSLYTPQMVVSGKTGFVGSDARRAKQELTNSQNPKYEFSVSLSASKKADSLVLETELRPFAANPLFDNLKVFAVVFENKLSNEVPRGENSGKTLAENFVVRSFREIKDTAFSGTKKLTLNMDWNTAWVVQNCGAVVFVQDIKTMEIKGLSWVYPLAGVGFKKDPTGI